MSRVDDTWISASEIGTASICEKRIYYKTIGKEQSANNNEMMKKGTLMHQKASSEHRYKKSSSCYIATCVYGENHETTNILREYRDKTMLSSTIGRLFARVYYTISPTVVKVFGKSIIFRFISNKLILFFIKLFVRNK